LRWDAGATYTILTLSERRRFRGAFYCGYPLKHRSAAWALTENSLRRRESWQPTDSSATEQAFRRLPGTKKGRRRLLPAATFSLNKTNFRPDCDWVESLEERRESDSAARCLG
jgi:hypothetical protein